MDPIRNVPLLTLSNYGTWSRELKVLLMDRGCWSFIDNTEEPLDAEATRRERNDFHFRKDKAFSTIYFSISDEFKPLLTSTTDGSEAWKLLKQHFEPQSRARLMQLLDIFFGTKMQSDETVGLFLSRVKKAVQDLADADHPVPEIYQAFQAIRYLPCDDSAEIDFELGNVSKKLSQKMAAGREEEKDIGKAIRQHQQLNAALEKCIYCLDQPNMKKYLIVDIGEQVYICLPNFQTMTSGHCLIVPKSHVSSFLSLDENEWREVELFKSYLRNMFRAQNKSVIFLETSMNFRYHPHAIVECIPVPEDEGDMAPLYFKKAIQESEVEWAHNKKLIDLKNKGLCHSVPKSLPYFHVEFDPKIHAGFAHVIEEEKYFPRNFGKEIVGGMLDIDYNHLFKNRKEDPLKKSQEVVEFEKMWKEFKNENS